MVLGMEVDLSVVFLVVDVVSDYEKLCVLDVFGLVDLLVGDQLEVYKEFCEQLIWLFKIKCMMFQFVEVFIQWFLQEICVKYFYRFVLERGSVMYLDFIGCVICILWKYKFLGL